MTTIRVHVIFPIVWLFICTNVCNTDERNNINNAQDNENVFVPTHEWQVVKKGQAIPKGLHIRVNFETGITEAKLLDGNENNNRNSALVATERTDGVVSDVADDSNSNFVPHKELESALKNIKNDDAVDINPDEIKQIKDKYRSYAEIKKELDELKISAKTDAQIIKELTARYFDTSGNSNELLTILQDLEYLVHQIDNAEEFVQQNGFKNIIYTNLNGTAVDIKLESLNLFGAAVQNNPKVQIHALETGSVNILTRVLTVEKRNDVLSRAVFALSCLLHRFPLAQKQFAQNGGIAILSGALTDNKDLKLKIKICTLINDLIEEHDFAIAENDSVKLQQYNLVNIRNTLSDHNWCEHLSNLLVNAVSVDATDHDLIEKCLKSILTLVRTCRFERDVKFVENLILLQLQYRLRAEQEAASADNDTDNYFLHLYQSCSQVLQQFNKVKSEL